MKDKILKLINQSKSDERKSININIDKKLIDEVDYYSELVSKKYNLFCPRNTFIEVACKEYLNIINEDIEKIKLELREEEEVKKQIIIFTASEKAQTYKNMFQNGYWSCVSLGKEVKELIDNKVIEYFAVYRGNPCQHIDAYAKIKNIEPDIKYPSKYKFELYEPIFLDNPIVKGNVEPSSLMKGKRVDMDIFLQARSIEEFSRDMS